MSLSPLPKSRAQPRDLEVAEVNLSGSNSAVECDLAKVEVAGSNPVSRSSLAEDRFALALSLCRILSFFASPLCSHGELRRWCSGCCCDLPRSVGAFRWIGCVTGGCAVLLGLYVVFTAAEKDVAAGFFGMNLWGLQGVLFWLTRRSKQYERTALNLTGREVVTFHPLDKAR